MAASEKTPKTVRATLDTHRYRTAMHVDDFDLIADEPAELGGDDQGPRPVSLLLGALGACTSITLRMYTERKDWPLEGVEVEMYHERRRADDYTGDDLPEGTKGLFDYIRMKITIDGNELDADQMERIGVIAGKCPVHRILTGPLVIDTSIEKKD
jgi:putative redox protein